jgi:hypothetical protein
MDPIAKPCILNKLQGTDNVHQNICIMGYNVNMIWKNCYFCHIKNYIIIKKGKAIPVTGCDGP